MSFLRTDTEYKNYFEALAGAHKDIRSMVFGDDDRLKVAEENDKLSGWSLWLDDPRPATLSGARDNYQSRAVAPFMIFHPAPAHDTTHDNEDKLFAKAKEIATDVLSRILRDTSDRTKGLVNAEIIGAQMGKSVYITTSTRYVGYLVELPFLHPVNLAYESTKWND